MDGLFQERPCLAGDVRLRDSEDGPLLVRASRRRSLLLSAEEASAVTLMDGDHTMAEIAARLLAGSGRLSYARLVVLIQTLAAGGFLAHPMPRLGAFGQGPSLRWVFDLPLLMIPGVGAAAPRLPAWLLSPALLLTAAGVAGLLAIPLLYRVLDDPAVAARVNNSWELAVLVLFALGMFAGSVRGLARAAWLRTIGSPRPAAGLRLRHGLLVLDISDRGADLQPPGWRADLGTAGLLGLSVAAVIIALGMHFLPAPHVSAQPYVAVPLLLLFVELCPFLSGDGGRLSAGIAMLPDARADLASVLLRGGWFRATLGILRHDRLALLSTGWLIGAGLLSIGPVVAVFSAWVTDLMASPSVGLRVVGALPLIAWLGLVGYGIVAATSLAARRLLLAQAMRIARHRPRRTMPDIAAHRVLFASTGLDILAEERQAALLTELRVRVTHVGEALGADAERESLFAVQSGRYVLERGTDTLVEFGPGDVFGGLGLVETKGLTLRTVEAGRVMELPGQHVTAVLEDLAGLRDSMQSVLLTRARLRSCPTLWSLPGRVIDTLVGRAETRSLAAGELLFDAGDESRDLYVLVRGQLHLHAHVGRPTLLAHGDIAGAGNVLESAYRRWRVSAVSEAEVVRLPWAMLSEIVAANPMLGLALEARAANQRPAL